MRTNLFLKILFFTVMFTMYLTFSWFLVSVFYSKWFFNGLFTHRELMGIALVISILNAGPATSFKTQLRLAFYDGAEYMDKYQNKSTIWSQILVPYVFLIVGLIINLILK